MEKIGFYAHYRCVMSGGCNRQIATTEASVSRFPPAISLYCEKRKQNCSLSLANTYTVSTPNQLVRFTEMCDRMGIEMGVEIKIPEPKNRKPS